MAGFLDGELADAFSGIDRGMVATRVAATVIGGLLLLVITAWLGWRD